MKRTVAALLITASLAGCATIRHPMTPNVQYSSMQQCRAANPEMPQYCEKVMHQQATQQAVATTAVTVGVLAQIAYIVWVIVSLGR